MTAGPRLTGVRCVDCGSAARSTWAILHKRDCPQRGKPDWIEPVARYERFVQEPGRAS